MLQYMTMYNTYPTLPYHTLRAETFILLEKAGPWHTGWQGSYYDAAEAEIDEILSSLTFLQ